RERTAGGGARRAAAHGPAQARRHGRARPPRPQGSRLRMKLRVNGPPIEAEPEPRTLLADLIRDLGLTGTKLGCEQGTCGACTVQLDGEPARACLLLAVPAGGAGGRPVEGLAGEQ